MKNKHKFCEGYTATIVVVIMFVLLLGGGYLLTRTGKNDESSTKLTPTTAATETRNEGTINDGESKAIDNTNVTGRYVDYSMEQVANSASMKRVYFFHADWCPTCRAADNDFITNAAKIPNGVTVFKTNYDTETELKEKFNITSQHTFVQVDENESMVTKWIGGGVEQLANSIK